MCRDALIEKHCNVHNIRAIILYEIILYKLLSVTLLCDAQMFRLCEKKKSKSDMSKVSLRAVEKSFAGLGVKSKDIKRVIWKIYRIRASYCSAENGIFRFIQFRSLVIF